MTKIFGFGKEYINNKIKARENKIKGKYKKYVCWKNNMTIEFNKEEIEPINHRKNLTKNKFW